MKRTVLLIIVFLLVLALCNFLPIPYSAAQPFNSPELTPPFRPTPTGWPDAPFPEPHRERAETSSAIAVEMLPTPTLSPRSATLVHAARHLERKRGR